MITLERILVFMSVERVQPGLLALTVWIPICVWVYSCIAWMISDEIDVFSGFLGLALAFVAGGYVMIRYSDPLSPVINGVVWVIVLSFTTFRAAHTRRQLAKADYEAMERAYETLSFRPNGLGPIMKIAGLAYRYGAAEHAIGAAEAALASFPKTLVAEDWRQVNTWRGSATLDPQKSIRCTQCGTAIRPGPVVCPRCGNAFLLSYVKGHWADRKTTRRFMIVWLAGMFDLLTIGFLSTSLPKPLAIVASVGILGFTGVSSYFAWKLWAR